MLEENTGTTAADRKVVISPEDSAAALEFWKHFEIPIPTELQAAVDKFSLNPSFENQQEIKFQMVKAISTSDHEAFKEEMFKKIVEECTDVTYSMNFDRDLENTLSDSKAE